MLRFEYITMNITFYDDCLSLRIMSNALLESNGVDKITSTNFSKIDQL